MPESTRSPRVSLSAQAEHRLKTALITGAMMPGTRLVTKYLAMEMGMSITPVREALLRLAAVNALDMTPAQTFIVPQSCLSRYQEINTLRKTLEIMALRESVSRMDSQHMRALRRLHRHFSQAADVQPDKAMIANMLLRQRLYSIAMKPTLLELIEQLWMRLGPGYYFLWHQPGALQHIYQHYDALLTLLEDRNGPGAEQLMTQIIENGNAALIARHQQEKTLPVTG